jgi:hypothetical protein
MKGLSQSRAQSGIPNHRPWLPSYTAGEKFRLLMSYVPQVVDPAGEYEFWSQL